MAKKKENKESSLETSEMKVSDSAQKSRISDKTSEKTEECDEEQEEELKETLKQFGYID